MKESMPRGSGLGLCGVLVLPSHLAVTEAVWLPPAMKWAMWRSGEMLGAFLSNSTSLQLC